MFLTAPKAGSPRSRCCQSWFPLQTGRENLFHALSCFLVVSSHPLAFLSRYKHHPDLSLHLYKIFSLSACLCPTFPLLKRTLVVLDMQSIQLHYDLVLTYLITSQWPYFQGRSHLRQVRASTCEFWEAYNSTHKWLRREWNQAPGTTQKWAPDTPPLPGSDEPKWLDKDMSCKFFVNFKGWMGVFYFYFFVEINYYN